MRRKPLAELAFLAISIGLTACLLAFTYTFDTATPLGSDAPSTIDDKIREVKAAIQERENVDHYWTLTGTQVSAAAAGKHRQVTFQAAVSDPTPGAGEGILWPKTGTATYTELAYDNSHDSSVQITENGQLYLTGTYAQELALTNTGNTINADAVACTDGGYLTLPHDTTDTSEGNLRYNTSDDTVSVKQASAWAALALASSTEYGCSGTATGDGGEMSVDVGFTPQFVIAWNEGGTTSPYIWVAHDAAANFYLGGQAKMARTTTLGISVSSTTISFPDGVINDSGVAYHYVAFSLTVGNDKDPT